ncbi:MAG: folate family ECF transporter S component [Clostridia bacterium]|nr:folate family ECF transporter S component [Clostridia bacterium]
MEKENSRNLTKKIAVLALLTALGVVLGRFVPLVNILTSKYEFSFVAIMVAAYLMGPVGGAVVGGLVDIIGALIVPTGAYFPGFTVTAVITGAVWGFLFCKKCSIPRILIGVISTQTVCSLLINTWFIAALFSPKGFTALLAARAVQAAIMAVLQIVFAIIFFNRLNFKKRLNFIR